MDIIAQKMFDVLKIKNYFLILKREISIVNLKNDFCLNFNFNLKFKLLNNKILIHDF